MITYRQAEKAWPDVTQLGICGLGGPFYQLGQQAQQAQRAQRAAVLL